MTGIKWKAVALENEGAALGRIKAKANHQKALG